ncbi:MAG TPA: hypothetical protein PKW37_05595 [Salinivirgaceae bacterium]|nr:hypothetical protein [Salinivirgaceae bacterium]
MLNNELKIVSRIAKLHTPSTAIYRMISDFSFLDKITPPDDRVKIVSCNSDMCKIAIEGGGEFTMVIAERKENELVKISNDSNSPFDFKLWIQLKEKVAYETYLRITLHATMNPFMKMVAQKPLTNFVESMVDKLEQRFSVNSSTYDSNYEA